MLLTLPEVFDLIGTIAFALSGSFVAVSKKMDIFGVNMLAVATACGGGLVRDLIIGNTATAAISTPEAAVNKILKMPKRISPTVLFRSQRSINMPNRIQKGTQLIKPPKPDMAITANRSEAANMFLSPPFLLRVSTADNRSGRKMTLFISDESRAA